MHIRDIFQSERTTFSFEFFPPKTAEAAEGLFTAMTDLEPLRPSFVSVTYGAGGSTRELTRDLVVRLKTTTKLDPVPHLTCVCHSERDIAELLERYAQAGISNILALGGDVPRDRPHHDRGTDAFRYASDLVRYLKQFNEKHGGKPGGHPDKRGFGICVAGYPEGHPGTPNRVKEMDHLKAKVDAGADWICTQLFFDNRDFYDFRDRCEIAGIKVPIVAGVMPITSVKGMQSMAEMAAGCRFPAPLQRMVNRCHGDAEAVRRVGVHWASQQCADLLERKVAGIHFYTLNRSTATREVFANLGVTDASGLRG
ncbi:MAG: methylenetetrahydrofolate reductase [NAD(P)H] [Planctomycetaceae bacterium]|nr:methylenetetrahydrofolate reductase [NAD(P)H] [Phycisphaerales bacterium]MCE2652812.1 methylenetetrahydrofolate reductase [NAD(P)H] [Planctomycetaceae bacterium]